MIESFDGYRSLRNDMKAFENAIRNLSMGINNCGISWRDEQYEQLAGMINNEIAFFSKRVLQAGVNCENAMKKFERIAEEV